MGVFGLGLFVGYLIAIGLKQSKPTLRAVLTVLGASLGGVPVAFLAGAGSKWIYPIGLLAGLLFFRITFLWASISSKKSRAASESTTGRSGALFEVGGIGALVFIMVTVALLLPDKSVVTERGQLTASYDVSRYSIYYPTPFEGSPQLVISGADYELSEQRADGFVLRLISYSVGNPITWQASGVQKQHRER